MKIYLRFLCVWLVNSLLLWIAHLIYPASFVLGTYRMSALASVIVAGLAWTFLVWLAQPVLRKFRLKVAGRPKVFLVYFLANFVAIWIVARLAPFTGFGIPRFFWAIILAFTANLVQYLVWHFFCKKVLA